VGFDINARQAPDSAAGCEAVTEIQSRWSGIVVIRQSLRIYTDVRF
jgi:hypothetical protein